VYVDLFQSESISANNNHASSFYRSNCRVHYQTAEQSENKQSPGADE